LSPEGLSILFKDYRPTGLGCDGSDCTLPDEGFRNYTRQLIDSARKEILIITGEVALTGSRT